jgi:hypothetical protein
MRTPRLRPVPPRDEEGVALLTVILMLALVSALTLTIAVVATNNLVSARLSQQAGAAVNASDAGVSQAISYLRKRGTRDLACSPTCASNPWGNSASPATVTVSGRAGQSYNVWIETLAAYPANKPGRYLIHSTGYAGGSAGRTVTVETTVTPLPMVYGVVAGSVVGGGDAGVHKESIFSTGCIYQRSKIEFQGIDVAYGIPSAAHSSQIITDSNGSGKTCTGTNKPIHDPTKTGEAKNCSVDYPYDQDKYGGPLSTTGLCYNKARAAFGNLPQFNDASSLAFNYPTTSLIADDAALASTYKAKRPPFTQAQLDQLKSIAMSDNTYYTSATGWSVPSGPDAVMYFDLTATDPGGRVDLNDLAVAPWNRPAGLTTTSPQCTANSLLVIIEGGNARLNSNSTLAASLFLVSDDPYGNVTKANGTSTFTGNIYANSVDLTGTTDLYMDECFMANPPPALNALATRNYREIDR